MGEIKNCTRVTISLNNDVLAELDRRAEELACPRSVYIAMALRQKWLTEDNMANMPAMMETLANATRVIDEYKNCSKILHDTAPAPSMKAD